MIHNKTRIFLSWFSAISLVGLAFYAIGKGFNDVSNACIGALMVIVSAYTAGKTLNNIKKP